MNGVRIVVFVRYTKCIIQIVQTWRKKENERLDEGHILKGVWMRETRQPSAKEEGTREGERREREVIRRMGDRERLQSLRMDN